MSLYISDIKCFYKFINISNNSKYISEFINQKNIQTKLSYTIFFSDT